MPSSPTWFSPGPTRSARARLEVEGPFGLLSYDLDQRSHGRRWSPITRQDLLAADSVKVRLESQDNALLGFDAMRLGSGVHSSRHPWWEMGCDPFTDYQEAPPEVTANGDVTSRPVYAEFFGADERERGLGERRARACNRHVRLEIKRA